MIQIRVGISIGDINGIGPEVILKTLNNKKILEHFIPVIYTNKSILNYYKKQLSIQDLNYTVIKDLGKLNPKNIYVFEPWNDLVKINEGTPNTETAHYAALSLKAVGDDLKAGKIDACVTAPIHKESIQASGFDYPGQTEFFTEISGAKDSLMLLCSDQLKIGTVSGHIPLNKVTEYLSKDLISNKIKILLRSMKRDFQIEKPKIAVLGLNPHAGENGKIGTTEKELIEPIIEEFRNRGDAVFGPYPSDGLFGSGNFRKFDAILAMYHDQALIPFKMTSFDEGINYTAGLDLIRTSPDHGTAFDIAGKDRASENSFRQAIYMAVDISRKRKELTESH